MNNDAQVEQYLGQLRKALSGMTLAEREDIVQEIGMHIRERCADQGQSEEAVIAGLGPAAELAQQYRTGLLVQKASRSASPWLILRAALRWALTGIEGSVVFLLAFCGYAIGAGFVLMALLKPFFPHRTGLWIGPGEFSLSFRMGVGHSYPPANVHEVLGPWLIPVCLVLGSLTIAATTKLIQVLMSRFHWKLPFVTARVNQMTAWVS